MLNRSGDFLQQIVLVDDADLIVGQLQLHVELRIAGIEHIGNQGQTVYITLADNIEVFMRQLNTFTLCPQSNIGFIEIDIGRMDRILASSSARLRASSIFCVANRACLSFFPVRNNASIL